MRWLALLCLFGTAHAEWWGDDPTHTFTSPGKNHVLVGTARDKDTRLELRAGQKQVTVVVLPGAFSEVVVCDREPAAVLWNAGIAAVACIDRGGQRWHVPADQLYDKDAPLGATKYGPIWRWHWWVDEKLGVVFVVSFDHEARTIDLKSGAVRVATGALLLRAFPRREAIEVAAEWKTPGVIAAATPLVEDETLPLGIRVRAAVAIQWAGGKKVPLAMLKRVTEFEDRDYVILYADRLLEREEAVAFLEEAALWKDCGRPAMVALASMGGKSALRALVGLMVHEKIPASVKREATTWFGNMPKEGLTEQILGELKDAENDIPLAGNLMSVLVNEKVGHLVERLGEHESTMMEVLARDAGPTTWIASYFAARPSTQAIKPLQAALREHRKDAVTPAVIAALKVCTGQDHGNDINAWLSLRPR